jgi:hypothetical protein
MRRIIYQALAFTVPVLAAPVTTGELVAATNVSTYRAPVKHVVQQPSAYVPIVVASVSTGELVAATNVSTYRPPIKRVVQQPQAYVPIRAMAGDADVAFASTSNQVINRTVIYEDRTTYADTPVAAETVTVDKWWRQLDIPVRRRVLTDPQEHVQAPPKPEANDTIGWHRALDLPVRRRFVVAEEGSNFSAPPRPEANDAIGWHRALELPTRRKFTWYGEYGYGNFTPHTNDARWYAPLDTPVRRRTAPYTDYGFVHYPIAAFSPGDANLAFTTTSPQIVSRTIVYESDAFTPFTPAAELVTVDKWWRQLDVPVRRKQITAEEGSFFPPGGKPEANDTIGWHRSLDEPRRFKRLPIGGYQFEARASFPQVPWGWYAELAKPTRLTKTPANQVSLTFVAAAPGNGNAYNWFLPLEIPTRARKLNEYPATSIPVYFVPPTPGAGNEYNWFEPLNAPHRLRPSIRTAQQQSLTVPSRLLTVTLEYAWYQPLTTPTRLAWLNRSRQGESPYQTENVTIDKWWRELIRPIYTRRIDRPALAQGNINPVVPLAWQPLHSPHRLKGRISYPFEARAIFPLAFPGNGNGTTQPWPALSEPVRLKSYYHQPNAGLVWTTSFVLPAYDPDRVVCVHFESRSVDVEAFSRTVTPNQSRTVTVEASARVVEPDEQSRSVTPDERQSCQES